MRRVAGFLVVCALLAAPAFADPQPLPANFFPFVIPWDDAVPGTANDMSFLNDKPAGKNGRIVVKDGHLAEETTGKRVRFFGTNVTAAAAFPTHADAEKFAAALAKRGINIVRLHHLDNWWAVDTGGSIWTPNANDHRHVDAKQLEKLDYFIAQLIKNGIYINMNLKVGKVLTPADGFPESVSKIPYTLQKRVDLFDARMIELQKDYANQLLTHTNPYTGHRYADEPAVATVEINNENSLLALWPGQRFGSGLDQLPEPFAGELLKLWNGWLGARYANDDELVKAWNKDVEPLGDNVPSARGWTVENQTGARCEVKAEKGADPDVVPPVTITVPSAGTQDWHAQAILAGLDLKDHQHYTLQFEIKSATPRKAQLMVMMDVDPWIAIGVDQQLSVTPQWQQVTIPFVAEKPVPNRSRLSFGVGLDKAAIDIRNLKLQEGTPPVKIMPGESLSSKNIGLAVGGTGARYADFVQFLVDTESAYAKQMRDYVRNDLGIKAPVMVTQVQWSGTAGFGREAASDIIDSHGYAEHPQFPADADWSPTRWTIAQQSQVRTIAKTTEFTLADAARFRVKDKPFSISEYDQAAPNDFAAECVPMLAAYAAVQDWDAIYTFAQSEYGPTANTDRITGFFDHTHHPAKAAFNAFAAMVFRTAALSAEPKSATLTLPKNAFLEQQNIADLWRQSTVPINPLTTRLNVVFGDKSNIAATPVGPRPQFFFERDPRGNGRLKLASERAAGVIGFIGGKTITAGALRVSMPTFGNDFAAVTLSPVDNQTISASKRLLLTIVGRAENQKMGWNESRTSVADQWGTGPVHCEGLAGDISIAREQPAKVYALKPTGERGKEIPATFDAGRLAFHVSPEDATVWYELAE